MDCLTSLPTGTTLEQYFSAVARREISWFRSLGQGTCRERSESPNTPQRDAHIDLLEKFLKIIPHILPKDELITYPTLWHTDLHGDNIFVENSDPSTISAIIDWQGVWAAPFFLQARFPSVFNCEWSYPWGAVMPQLPADFDELSEGGQKQAEQELSDVKLKKFYEVASRKFNQLTFRAMDAMEFDDDNQTTMLFYIVGRSWIDGPIPLRHLLVQVVEQWGTISADSGSACPISFSEGEGARAQQDMEAWAKASGEYFALKSRTVGKDGWVGHDEYDEAKAQFRAHQQQLDELRHAYERLGGRDVD
ncbi:MAG: hypothetical protein M1832_001968 [Thelocarpon impressellum]|nr:MAG: hypothetical protein M1832_001968 [Thelocarpon impressellum]